MMAKRFKVIGVLLSLLVVSACGGGGGGGVVITPPVSGQTTVEASTSGVTSTTAAVSLGTATVSVPSGTTLKAADGTPVTGKVEVTAAYATNAVFLPVQQQATLPAGETLKGYVSINITGDQKVKTVNPPIPVSMKVAVADGVSVDIYSNNEGPNDVWVKEGTATVSGGHVSFNVSHFTAFAAFQQKLTGSSNGGTNAQ